MTGVNLVVSTSAVIPASVAVPLGAAALMAGFSRFLPRWARDLIAIAVALTLGAKAQPPLVPGSGRETERPPTPAAPTPD